MRLSLKRSFLILMVYGDLREHRSHMISRPRIFLFARRGTRQMRKNMPKAGEGIYQDAHAASVGQACP